MIEGTVDNGNTANIVIMGKARTAGVREHEGVLEVAYLGRPPTAFPQPITVDGVEMTAIEAKPRAAKGFAVLTVVRDQDATAAD